jgi:hypothetical protein
MAASGIFRMVLRLLLVALQLAAQVRRAAAMTASSPFSASVSSKEEAMAAFAAVERAMLRRVRPAALTHAGGRI